MSDSKEDLALLSLLACDNSLSGVLVYAVLHEFLEETDEQRQNRRRRERWEALSETEKQKRTAKVPRAGTLSIMECPWMQLWRSQSLAGFVTVTGMDPQCFKLLLDKFAPIFWSHSPYSRAIDQGKIRSIDPSKNKGGRPRMMSCHACLGMVLFWTRTTCCYWTIAQYFGMTASPCDLWLRFGKRVLLHILSKREDAQICMPSAEKANQYKQAISAKYPSLKNVGLVGDGVKILIQKSGNNKKQNSYYNGWKSDHYVTNLFVFGPDGLIVACMLNCPGAMHDSELAALGNPSIYDKIDRAYEEHSIQCVMDSAFASRSRDSIIKSIPREACYIACETAQEAFMLEDALSVRQSAEWGMRALQAAMPRLKARWPYEERDERLIGLTLIALLYNFRCNNMGMNQIRNVFWTNQEPASRGNSSNNSSGNSSGNSNQN